MHMHKRKSNDKTTHGDVGHTVYFRQLTSTHTYHIVLRGIAQVQRDNRCGVGPERQVAPHPEDSHQRRDEYHAADQNLGQDTR